MISLLAATSIFPIAIIAFLYSKKLAHPAVIMAIVWIVVFVFLFLFSDLYYSLDPLPLTIITIGVIIYCLCAFLADVAGSRISSRKFSIQINSLSCFSLLCVCWIALPFYLRQQLALMGGAGSLLHQIRKNSLESVGGETFITNMLLVSTFTSVIYLVKYITHKNKMNLLLYILATITAIVYSILTGSKLPILSLFISNGLVIILLTNRGQIFYALGILIATVLVFLAGLYLINYAGVSSYGTPDKVISSALDYLLGGTVAFASNYETMLKFDNFQTIQNAFSSIPRKIGFNIEILPIHYPYVNIYKDRITNVYTVFFPLIKEYSVFGAMAVMAIFGFMHGFLYKLAYLRVEYFISYAIIMSSSVSVIFGDPLLFGSFTNLKYVLIAFIYYMLSAIFVRFKSVKIKYGSNNTRNA